MKSKWLDYQNILIIYLLWIIFYHRCKLDYLSNWLETYINVYHYTLIFLLWLGILDNYFIYYMMNMLNFMVHHLILILNNMSHLTQVLTIQIGKSYQLLFQKLKKSQGSSSSSIQNSTSEFQNYLITFFFEFVDTSYFDFLQWWKKY